jgi:hypothetical protein
LGRACNTNVEEEEHIHDSSGKARRNRPLGKLRRRLVDNIKMDLRELGWGGMNWIDVNYIISENIFAYSDDGIIVILVNDLEDSSHGLISDTVQATRKKTGVHDASIAPTS